MILLTFQKLGEIYVFTERRVCPSVGGIVSKRLYKSYPQTFLTIG